MTKVIQMMTQDKLSMLEQDNRYLMLPFISRLGGGGVTKIKNNAVNCVHNAQYYGVVEPHLKSLHFNI